MKKMIKLSVNRRVENSKYEEELKAYKERNNSMYGYSNNDQYPQRFLVEDILDVEITEKQFEVIRKEILKNF